VDRYLKVEHRASLVSALDDQNVPLSSFLKDTERIAKRLKGLRMKFASGIIMYGSREAFDDHVSRTSLDDGQSQVTVIDKISEERVR
jgi:hypothetical protein